MANNQTGSTSGNTASGTAGSTGGLNDLRDRASTTLSQFSGTASEQIDSSPLIAVAGGLALGAVLAAVIPQTERERGLLEPAGTKLTSAGRGAIDKVRENGKAKVDELAGDKVREFLGVSGSTSA
jgi:hypothetical protein